MLQDREKFNDSLLAVMDLFALTISWFTAYAIRFAIKLIPLRISHIPPLSDFTWLLIILIPLESLSLYFSGAWRRTMVPSLSRSIWRALRGHIVGSGLTLAAFFFVARYRPSRLMFVIFVAAAGAWIVVNRIVIRSLLIKKRRRGVGIKKAVVIGSSATAQRLGNLLARHHELGIEVIGLISDDRIDSPEIPVIGKFNDIQRIVERSDALTAFVALPWDQSNKIREILEALSDKIADIKVVPDLAQYAALRTRVEQFEGLPIVNLAESPLYGWRAIGKRIFDILIASPLLITASIPMLCLAIVVKLTSSGPVIFRQQRMGLDGRLFTMYKFRSMRADSESDTGPVWAIQNDARRTGIGSWMRRHSLDELPQLINVMKGDMSLVGPRPERPELINQFRKEIPRYMLRHRVKAGITGWAQVHGWRGNTPLDGRIECDLFYIQNWSFALDIKILWLTLIRGWKSENAY